MTGIDDFITRFKGYRGEVFWESQVSQVKARCVDLIREMGASRVGVSNAAAGLMSGVLEDQGIGVIMDLPTKVSDIPTVGITTALGLVNETGSLVLDDNQEGERPWSLVVDTHIALVINPIIFPTLNELFAWQGAQNGLCLISGPSRTADIEKQVILGMHGPKRVIAVIGGVGQG